MTNFKTIPEFPHLEINDLGTVIRSVQTKVELTICTNGTGYKTFWTISPTGVRCTPYVHRAVLSAHARSPMEGEITRHLDDDRSNNDLNNLVWGSYSENHADAVRNGRRGHRPKPVGRQPAEGIPSILAAFQDPEVIRNIRRAHWIDKISQSELARNYGVGQATISTIVRFKSYASIVSEPEVEAFRQPEGNA